MKDALAQDWRTPDENFQSVWEDSNGKRKRRSFSEQFKRNAVNLVVVEGYSFAAAARAVNVAPRSLSEWHEKYARFKVPLSHLSPTTDQLNKWIDVKLGNRQLIGYRVLREYCDAPFSQSFGSYQSRCILGKFGAR